RHERPPEQRTADDRSLYARDRDDHRVAAPVVRNLELTRRPQSGDRGRDQPGFIRDRDAERVAGRAPGDDEVDNGTPERDPRAAGEVRRHARGDRTADHDSAQRNDDARAERGRARGARPATSWPRRYRDRLVQRRQEDRIMAMND